MNQEILFSLLDELDKTGIQLNELKIALWNGAWALKNPPTFEFIIEHQSLLDFRQIDYGGTFLSLALKHHLVDYVVARAGKGCMALRFWPQVSLSSQGRDNGGRPWITWPLLLDAVTSGPQSWCAGEVKKLLSHGADPNFMIPGELTSVPWACALKFLVQPVKRTKTTPNGWKWKWKLNDPLIQEVWLPLVEHDAIRLDDDQLDDKLFEFLKISGGLGKANDLSLLKRFLSLPVPEALVEEDSVEVMYPSERFLASLASIEARWNQWRTSRIRGSEMEGVERDLEYYYKLP